jgi:hypothetical protein
VEAAMVGFRRFYRRISQKLRILKPDLIILIHCLIFVRDFIKTLDRIEIMWIIGDVGKYY